MVNAAEKMKLAESLGFKKQVEITKKLVAAECIDKVMVGEFAREVSTKDMEDLLGMTKRKKDILLIGLSIMGFIAALTVFFSIALPHTCLDGIIIMGCILFIIAGGSIKTIYTDYVLQVVEAERYTNDIPYGGLLKIKEAEESKFFHTIGIVSAEKIKNDPLIVGFTGEVSSNLWMEKYCKAYLIYAWDMDKDQDKLKIL